MMPRAASGPTVALCAAAVFAATCYGQGNQMSNADRRLSRVYARHGVNLRKHLGIYPGWTARQPTVVDLDENDRRVLEEKGDAALEAHLREKGQYPFPALTVTHLKSLHRRTELVARGKAQAVIYTGGESHHAAMARKIVARIERATGLRLPVVEGDLFRERHLKKTHALILGPAHVNAAAAILTDRYFLNADAALPGPQGLLIQTVHNPSGLGHNVVHVCCGRSRSAEAVKRLIDAIQWDDGAALDRMFVVEPDPGSFPGLADKPKVLRHFARMTRHADLRKPKGRSTNIAQIIRQIARWYDSGGKKHDRYNRGPMNVLNAAAEIYGKTGDPDYLELFAGLVWEMMRYYCNSPGGASIISDMEFDLCWLMVHWDQYEEADCFSDDQRLILTNFLLASTEMCAGYKAERWPTPPGRMRHNHETFGALALLFSGRYFHDYYALPVADEWLEIAHECFRGPIENHFKFREDANLYQWLVPAHKVTYDRVVGAHRFARKGLLAKVAHNIIVTTDNFGYPCDFGDAGAPISGGQGCANLLQAAAAFYGDGQMQWVADHIRANMPHRLRADLDSGSMYLPASRRTKPTRSPTVTQLDKMPLDDHIRGEYAPQIPRTRTYDKIAFRESWSKSAQYLLLDGYSAGSHIHRDQNAVIRFNQLGRLWIVDNGYGKQSGVTRVGEAYSTRQLGPEDHNTLQFVRVRGDLALPPPLCDLRTSVDLGSVAVVQSALEGYARSDWLRTLVWVKGGFFLVVDQVNVGMRLRELKCQWNMLGRLKADGGLAVCRQEGANLFLHSDPAVPVETATYTNASWDPEIRPEIYPYATLPIQKLNQVVSRPKRGDAPVFVSLFYASRGERPSFQLEIARESGPALRVQVRGRRLKDVQAEWRKGRSHLVCGDGVLELVLRQPWK